MPAGIVPLQPPSKSNFESTANILRALWSCASTFFFGNEMSSPEQHCIRLARVDGATLDVGQTMRVGGRSIEIAPQAFFKKIIE